MKAFDSYLDWAVLAVVAGSIAVGLYLAIHVLG